MIRAPVPDLAQGEQRLSGGLGHYLARVLRLRAGDPFVAFDPSTGRESDAVTVWADDDAVTVRFGPLREGAARQARAITLVQGLAKGDKCDAVVRDATELGATRIVVATTRRSVVKLDAARAIERQARWARIAQEAARQCGRSDAPRVEAPCPWPDALASDPAPESDDRGWTVYGATTSLVTVWWACWLGSNLLGNVSARVDEPSLAGAVGLAGSLIMAVAAVACIQLMRKIVARQEATAARLALQH